jgi:ribosomal protein S17
MNAREGDVVTIRETRPISKTKNFIVTNIEERA